MIFNKTTITSKLASLVGFYKENHTYYQSLPTALKTSNSGFYVNALPGVTFDAIESTIKTEIKDVNLVVGEKYKIEVAGDGVDFTSVGAANNTVGTEFTATGTEPTWGSTGELKLLTCNEYLDDIYEQEGVKLMQSFVNRSKELLKLRAILSNQDIIVGVPDFSEKVTTNDRFVGYLLSPKHHKSLKVAITKLGLMLDTAQTLTIHLFETSQKEAIATYDFTYNPTNSTPSIQWEEMTDWFLRYANQYGIGSKYLIGYYESDLTGQALKMDWNNTNVLWSVFGKHMGVVPVCINSSYLNGTNLPDNADLTNHAVNYICGLFMKFSVTPDITNYLSDYIDVFAEALQYALAIRILEDAFKSKTYGRHNPKRDSNLEAWNENIVYMKGKLYGGNITDGNGYLKYQKGILDNLVLDFSGLDELSFKSRRDDFSIRSMA